MAGAVFDCACIDLILVYVMIREQQTWFIGNKIWDLSYDLQVKEWIFPTTCEQILVLHKKNLKMMRPQEIGDGMQVVKLNNTNWSADLDIESVVWGMCIYEWFDENVGTVQYYAYAIDRDKVDRIQDICNTLALPITIDVQKFVCLKTSLDSMHNTWTWLLSYMFGLALIYGHFDIWEQGLKHVKIHLPLEWSIAQSQERILAAIEWLHRYDWLYITYDYQDQKNWQILQLHINDQELLDIWSTWLGGEEYDMSEYHTMIQEYVRDELDLSNYVLKFLHK